MSYLTGRCEVCEGTARIHKGQETECTKTPDCSGCARCRDCIDGKVVSLPGAKRSATIGKGTPARINTVRQQNRQASATFFRSPTTTAATDVADIYAAYGSPEPGSPGLPAHELPLAPVLNRKRTLIEEAVAILERGDVDDADPSQDSQQPPMLAPSRSSSMNRLSSPEPRVPASLMALFDTMPEESVLPSESVIPTESAQPRSSTAVRRSSSMGPRSRQLSVVATIAESPQSRETTEALPTTSEQEGAQVQHPVRLSTSVRSIIEKEAVLSPVLSSPTLGEPNTKFIPDLRGATSVGDMSAKQSPVPGESPKTEKRKGLGIFGKKKKSETPMATIPQSLHGQSQIPPSPESRDRAKTSEPTSTKGLFSRMRKTSSFGKIPDPTKVAPEALVPEEKISTEFISGGTEEVTVEGQGGGGPPYPTVTHRRAVAGPRIQTIVHDLHEDVVQPRPTGRQYDSIDLLNDRAVARTTKPLFEDGVELRDKSKSVDNLLQSDKKGRLASDIFSFAKKKKSFAADSNMSASTSSLAPSLAVETTLPRPAVSSPQGTSPMHALSGGVAIRKSKKPLCVTIRTPQSGGQPDTDPSPQSVASTPAKEHRRTPSRNFKDWYTKYANDAVKQRLEEMSEERTFPDPITLDFIFGSKLSGPKDAVHSFAKASRCYETSRKDPLWDVRGNNEAPGTHKGRDTVHLELVDDIAYKYRPLDIFHDGKLKGVSYSQAVHGPVLDIIVDGRRDDLLDALIFPLEQDMSYAEVFLATFRFYMPSDLLMDSLIEWYNVDIDPEIASAPLTSAIDPSGTDSLADISPGTAPQTDAAYHRPQHESFLKKHRKHIQSRVVRVLMMWVKNHWHDFQEDAALFKMLQAFVDHIASIGFGDGQKLSQAVREQRLSWYTTQYIPAFPPKRNHQLDNTKPWALVWEPEDFAKDLTYIDHFLFRQIRPDAYLHVLARPVEKEGAGRNVPLKVLLEYITWFRLVGSYTASTVLLEELPKKRARAIKHMIKIAKNCRDLRNYNTLFAILWGLKRPAIAKDHQAWEVCHAQRICSHLEDNHALSICWHIYRQFLRNM
ncbi:hypothetical protein DFJ77DRAFT_12701 [Powellomyces hirtus]|nr:hypothetical protein DFJ77DRAFT_12701 [Powellomyces hirtus]